MSTQANDRRWWSVFALVAIAMAAFLAILVCALLFWVGPLVRPPTSMPTATSTTAPTPTSTSASAAPTQPVVAAPTKAPLLPVPRPSKAPAPTVVPDFIPVLDTPVVPKDFVDVLRIGSDLEVVNVAYTPKPTGSMYLQVGVRNNGPANLVGKAIGAECTGAVFFRGIQPSAPAPALYGTGGGQALDAAVGSVFTINVPVSIDEALYYYPAIQCGLSFVGDFDPNLNNNAGVLSLP